jgi:hypothetical protein
VRGIGKSNTEKTTKGRGKKRGGICDVNIGTAGTVAYEL